LPTGLVGQRPGEFVQQAHVAEDGCPDQPGAPGERPAGALAERARRLREVAIDRLLIAQARVERMTILTRDNAITQ
jgi:hypothetical protein